MTISYFVEWSTRARFLHVNTGKTTNFRGGEVAHPLDSIGSSSLIKFIENRGLLDLRYDQGRHYEQLNNLKIQDNAQLLVLVIVG